MRSLPDGTHLLTLRGPPAKTVSCHIGTTLCTAHDEQIRARHSSMVRCLAINATYLASGALATESAEMWPSVRPVHRLRCMASQKPRWASGGDDRIICVWQRDALRSACEEPLTLSNLRPSPAQEIRSRPDQQKVGAHIEQRQTCQLARLRKLSALRAFRVIQTLPDAQRPWLLTPHVLRCQRDENPPHRKSQRWQFTRRFR